MTTPPPYRSFWIPTSGVVPGRNGTLGIRHKAYLYSRDRRLFLEAKPIIQAFVTNRSGTWYTSKVVEEQEKNWVDFATDIGLGGETGYAEANDRQWDNAAREVAAAGEEMGERPEHIRQEMTINSLGYLNAMSCWSSRSRNMRPLAKIMLSSFLQKTSDNVVGRAQMEQWAIETTGSCDSHIPGNPRCVHATRALRRLPGTVPHWSELVPECFRNLQIICLNQKFSDALSGQWRIEKELTVFALAPH
jgi:hypothetical protein